MSLYPSLEDMKVDQLAKAQYEIARQYQNNSAYSADTASAPSYPLSPLENQVQDAGNLQHMYPTLNDYMGLEFTPDVIAANMPEYLPVAEMHNRSMSQNSSSSSTGSLMSAPLSGSSIGLKRAQISHGIREVTLCKGSDGKIGVRVKDINKGVFVSLVKKGSPAALAGLRFGDQILQVNRKTVAGMSMDSVHDLFRKCPENGITMAVRDRPFERTITLHKDSTEHVGFQFKDGEITALIKDSSAARNGLLTNHHLLEVNGQNVVGLKDKDITEMINEGGQVITVTVMPSFVFKHIMKSMSFSLVTKLMDHSVPDL